ncbi:MAG: hypothetical protein Kow00107_02880 [Planctomycetota bacterium]
MASDSNLLKLFASGRNEDAFAEIVRRYGGMVFNVCRNILQDSESARDITQEVFLDLARSCSRVNTSLAGWLHKAAVNKSYSQLRRKVLERKAVAHLAIEIRDSETVDLDTLAPVLNGAIEELPDQFREPLVMHYLTGLDQSEIAFELGVNQSTVSRRIQSGLEQLRKSLAKRGLCVSAGALSLTLARNAQAEVAPELLDSIVRSAVEAVRKLPAPPIGGAATASSFSKGGITMLKLAVLCILGTIAATLGFGGDVPEPTPIVRGALEIPDPVSPLYEDKDEGKKAFAEEKRIQEWLHSKKALKHFGTIGEALELLSKLGNVEFIIDEDVDTDKELNFDLPEVEIHEVLSFIVSSTLADWKVEGTKIHIFSIGDRFKAVDEALKRFARTVKVKFEDLPLQEAVDELAELLKVKIESEAVLTGTITCELEAPGHWILEYILGMGYVSRLAEDAVVHIYENPVAQELLDALSVRHTYLTEGVKIKDVLESIEHATGLKVLHQDFLDVKAEMPAMHIRNLPLQDVLNALTHALNCGWEAKGNVLHIVQFRQAWNNKTSHEIDKEVKALLAKKISLNFKGISLRHLLEHLSEKHGISFRLDGEDDIEIKIEHNGTIHELLETICKKHGVKMAVACGVVVLSK